MLEQCTGGPKNLLMLSLHVKLEIIKQFVITWGFLKQPEGRVKAGVFVGLQIRRYKEFHRILIYAGEGGLIGITLS